VINLSCGAGTPSVNLAKQLGTSVMGVGLIEARLHRSQERTAAYQVLDLTVFLARDDRVLAFPDSFI